MDLSLLIYLFAASAGIVGGIYIGMTWENELNEEETKNLSNKIAYYESRYVLEYPGEE